MRYPVNDYKTKWYIAQAFGNKTSYGYHEGVDISLKTGGDSDLGEPIYAVSDGVVTSVHTHSSANTFGKHIHYKLIDKGWGDVWDHHAHCNEIFVKVGDSVKEGQKIATVGKTGTSLAHDHWAMKLQPTGIDTIAKTKEDLQKWINPVAFIEKWINNSPIQEQPTMTDQEKKDIESMKNLRAYNGVWYESKNVIASFEELKKETAKLATAINDKETVISKQSKNLLAQKEEIDSLTQKLSIAEDELAKKEELRDKWYKLYQQSQESLKTAKDQAAHYQKQCTDARKSSFEFATVKELLLEIAKKILK